MGALAAAAAPAGASLLFFFLFLFEACEGQIACAPPSNAFCPQGYCCGNNGYCGAGEAYCAPANCLSQCESPSSSLSPPPPAGLYYDPPPLYYYYAPPKENPHGFVWWLGIVGAVVAVTLGAIIICWFIARSAARYKNDNCECD